jgi:hypothetical protein
MFSIMLPERVSRSPVRSGTQPNSQDHPRGLTEENATPPLNGLSIARGNPRLGFELMNAKTMLACSSPEQIGTSRCGLVNRAASRTGAARDVAGMTSSCRIGWEIVKKPTTAVDNAVTAT